MLSQNHEVTRMEAEADITIAVRPSDEGRVVLFDDTSLALRDLVPQ